MNTTTNITPTELNFKPIYTADVPWLSGRARGTAAADKIKFPVTSQPLILKIPKNHGVTKSFFEGFLMKYSREVFNRDGSMSLSDLVKVVPLDGGSDPRFQETYLNLSQALVSLSQSWKRDALFAAAS